METGGGGDEEHLQTAEGGGGGGRGKGRKESRKDSGSVWDREQLPEGQDRVFSKRLRMALWFKETPRGRKEGSFRTLPGACVFAH